MKKNNLSINALIKRKNLLLKLKECGIKKTKKKALFLIEDLLEKNATKIILLAKEGMIINGRKLLQEEDIKNAAKKMAKEEAGWEI